MSFLFSAVPKECSNYITLANETRRVFYSDTTEEGDCGLFGDGTWVRFVPPAGTRVPISPVGNYRCGTEATGWYLGDYPINNGLTSSGAVCFTYDRDCDWNSDISITNCGSFYVFYLKDPPVCNARYCTI